MSDGTFHWFGLLNDCAPSLNESPLLGLLKGYLVLTLLDDRGHVYTVVQVCHHVSQSRSQGEIGVIRVINV